MKVLTFDTCLNKTYVTLSDDDKILASKTIENHNEKYHSAFLIPTIVSILKENKLVLQDIDVIGTNAGPGSFTGIRACVTVARVFAQQTEVPLVGVNSLEILSQLNNSDNNSVIVMDARKKQYYTATYDKDGKELQAPQLTNEEDVLKLNLKNSFVIADEASSKFLKENGIESAIFTESSEDLGLFLNKIVSERIKNAEKEQYYWAKLKPLYLQTPPVTVSSKPKVTN